MSSSSSGGNNLDDQIQIIYWAIGNDATCAAQGFFRQVGGIGTITYTLSLSIFYICIIKYNMREIDFQKKYEPYLHFIPNVCAWASGIYLLVAGYFNNAGESCWIASYPQNCINDADTDCIRG